MDSVVKSLNSGIKKWDPALFFQRSNVGVLHMYRKSGQSTISYVFSLTDDWTVKGDPVPWGLCPIIERLRAIDMWNDDTFRRMEMGNAKVDESKTRSFRNNIHAFFADFRSQLAKDTKDVNTALMDKKKDPRRKQDGCN